MATQRVTYSRGQRGMPSGRDDGWSQPRSFRRDGWQPDSMENGRGEGLAGALGWFSIGLGVAEVIAPGRVAHFIGVRDNADTRAALFAVGLREIVSGVGILTQRRPAGWMWSRVGGDVMDLALLGGAFNSHRNHRGKVAGAIAAVLGVALLDLYESRQLGSPDGAARPVRRSLGRPRIRMPERGTVHVKKTLTINRSPEEVYRFWHDFQNLPRFMSHLESVQVTGERRSHWKAKAPAGMSVEWDAEIVEDRPNERIAWRSVEGADVDNAGSVSFKAAPGGRGTEIRVDLRYDAPGGKAGAMVAKLFGEEPGQQVDGDLRRFKQVMEAGEVVHSDASIHRGMHSAQPAAENEHVRIAGR